MTQHFIYNETIISKDLYSIFLYRYIHLPTHERHCKTFKSNLRIKIFLEIELDKK
jgi:hypothetical protein